MKSTLPFEHTRPLRVNLKGRRRTHPDVCNDKQAVAREINGTVAGNSTEGGRVLQNAAGSCGFDAHCEPTGGEQETKAA